MLLHRFPLLFCLLLWAFVENSFGQSTSHWRVFKSSDGLAESAVTSIHISQRGAVWTAHPGGKQFSRLDGYDIVRFPAPGKNYLVGESPSGQIWSGDAEGLLELKGGSWLRYRVAEFSGVSNQSQPFFVPVKQGRVLALTGKELLEFNNEWIADPLAKVLHSVPESSLGRFNEMTVARDGGLWIAGTQGLAKIPGPSRNISGETHWQEFLPKLSPAVQNFQKMTEDDSAGITAMAEHTGGQKVLVYFNGDSWNAYSLAEDFDKAVRHADGTFWFVTETGLFTFNPTNGETLRNYEISAKRFFDIATDRSGAIWVGTDEGLFRHTLLPWKTSTESASPHSTLVEKLENYPALPKDFSSQHYFLTKLKNGDVWIGTSEGVARLQNQQWQIFLPTDASMPGSAFCMVELGGGKLWFGGEDKIWEFDGKKWSQIQGGLGRVNAIIKTRDGTIRAASSSGVYHYFQEQWLQNGFQEGLPAEAILNLTEDEQGQLRAWTASGSSLYSPQADTDAPRTQILPIQESKISREHIVTFRGMDKWMVTPVARLLFSYRLDEQDWSPWQSENSVSFPDLSAGTHYFQARTMDRNWNIDPSPARFEFAVILPWYQEMRLLWIAALGTVVALFFAAVAVNRHLQLRRSYAEVEKIVALRTQQLEKAHHELLHSQKMNALGTLAAGVAHDFNNILSIIKGSAQIIETNLDDPEKIRTRVSRIKTVVEQGASIVKAMLGFSSGPKTTASCDLKATIRDTIQLLGDRFLHETLVEFESSDSPSEIDAPKELIQQILLNLIFNAADAMTGRGKVIVRTGEIEQLPELLILRPAASAKYTFVSVQDFGCGIPAEILPRIFEPFFTTKGFSARRGTGLGLSMVYELAKETGCGLHVESIENVGSIFTLYFPVNPRSSAKEALLQTETA